MVSRQPTGLPERLKVSDRAGRSEDRKSEQSNASGSAAVGSSMEDTDSYESCISFNVNQATMM